MTFSPVVPVGGLAGWSFLNRTMARQTETFANQTTVRRDEAYFRERISSIGSAEELVSDRRLLRVALGAFGLEADIDSKFFIRKVLQDGTLDPAALGNRLSDKRYKEMSKAFGFGDFDTPNTRLSDFADKLLAAWKTRSFEAAVGVQNDSMRLALNARRELPAIANSAMSEDAKWFTMMGNPPLRKVFQSALALPQSFGAIDIDRQLTILKERSGAIFGTSNFSDFTDPGRSEALVRRFLLFADSGPSTSPLVKGSTALSLLSMSAGLR